MPFTPYHFGPSGFFGLAFRRWLDFPIFIFANVVVDVEVLLSHGWPYHRYFHTLLIGAGIGAAWGLAGYALQPFFRSLMYIIRIPYQTSLGKMMLSGILGVWLHVTIDSIYHSDVKIFWPSRAKPFLFLLSNHQVKVVCIVFLALTLVLYASILISNIRKQARNSPVT